jgi:hypothetical protein
VPPQQARAAAAPAIARARARGALGLRADSAARPGCFRPKSHPLVVHTSATMSGAAPAGADGLPAAGAALAPPAPPAPRVGAAGAAAAGSAGTLPLAAPPANVLTADIWMDEGVGADGAEDERVPGARAAAAAPAARTPQLASDAAASPARTSLARAPLSVATGSDALGSTVRRGGGAAAAASPAGRGGEHGGERGGAAASQAPAIIFAGEPVDLSSAVAFTHVFTFRPAVALARVKPLAARVQAGARRDAARGEAPAGALSADIWGDFTEDALTAAGAVRPDGPLLFEGRLAARNAAFMRGVAEAIGNPAAAAAGDAEAGGGGAAAAAASETSSAVPTPAVAAATLGGVAARMRLERE